MANIKQQIKRVRTNAVRTERNRSYKSELHTYIRKVNKAVTEGDKDTAVNALRTACNQSNNRDPVVAYDEQTVEQVGRRLKDRGLLRIVWSDTGRRTLKYHQTLDEVLDLAEDERALITVLLLRGPQAPGELRTRTERLHGFSQGGQKDPRSQFAIVLDGSVVSAPTMNAVITDGKAQITGSFTEDEAKFLSQQLKYGALPVSFSIDSEQQISATLGSNQLRMGIVAGLIGLALVCIYSLFQYRWLGLVTIASLVVAGVLTWLAITLLGWSANYRLSLAGVAGLVVAIGQTADSFIVYFERIRDEIRAGRTIPAAVDHGWQRARQTVLASKAVNLLAAVVLYFVAVGNVRGFAFTLGLTAVADLMVVFLFTHPVMVLLAHTRYFGSGAKNSGLDPEALDAVPLYRGAGRLRTPEDSDGLTIAERRRRAALAGSGTAAGTSAGAAGPTEAAPSGEAASSSGTGSPSSGTGSAPPGAASSDQHTGAGSTAAGTDSEEARR